MLRENKFTAGEILPPHTVLAPEKNEECSIGPQSRNAHDILHFALRKALRKYPTVKLTLVILPTPTGAMNRDPRYALSRELEAKQTPRMFWSPCG